MTYLEEHRFLYTKSETEISDRDFEAHIIRHNHDYGEVAALRELADVRGLKDTSGLTVGGTVRCGQITRSIPASRLAIVITSSTLHFGLARAFQTFASEKRKEVEIFDSLEGAIAWLADDDRESEIFRRFVDNA